MKTNFVAPRGDVAMKRQVGEDVKILTGRRGGRERCSRKITYLRNGLSLLSLFDHGVTRRSMNYSNQPNWAECVRYRTPRRCISSMRK